MRAVLSGHQLSFLVQACVGLSEQNMIPLNVEQLQLHKLIKSEESERACELRGDSGDCVYV